MDDNSQVLIPPVEVDNFEREIFSSVFKKDENWKERRNTLIKHFGDGKIFSDEYFALYLAVKNSPNFLPDERYMVQYLLTNRANFMRSDRVAMQSRFTMGEGVDPFAEFLNCTKVVLQECITTPFVSDEAFQRAIVNIKLKIVRETSSDLLQQAHEILIDGKTVGRETLAGFEGMKSYLTTNITRLDKLNTTSPRRGVIVYRDIREQEVDSDKFQFICKYGLNPLDEAVKGIYEGEMISILAPTKGGKSRFSTFILHNAVVSGIPIVMWSIENGYKGWECLIRARHFEWYYNNNPTESLKKYITNEMILKDDMSQELSELEQTSWNNLRTSEKFGKIANLDEDFYAETFLEVLDNAVNMIGAKIVCIDYLQMLTGNDKSVQRNAVIADAYMKVLQYLKAKKIAGIFPAQFKQLALDDFKKTKDEDFSGKELRDIAGESYEVMKTPDVNYALYASASDLRDGVMKLLSVPSRNSKVFAPIRMFTSLGSCTFKPFDDMAKVNL